MLQITQRDPAGKIDDYARWLLVSYLSAQRRAHDETASPKVRRRAVAEVEAFAAAFSNLPVSESEEALGVVTPTARSVQRLAPAWVKLREAFPDTVFRLALFYVINVPELDPEIAAAEARYLDALEAS